MPRVTTFSNFRCGAVVIFLLSVLSLSAAQPAHCPIPTVSGSSATAFRPNPPRVYPFCVGKDPDTGKWDDEIQKQGFDKIIDDVNKKRVEGQKAVGWKEFEYDPFYDSLFLKKSSSNPTFVEKGLYPHYLMHVYKPSQKAKMTNWLHVELFGMYERSGLAYLQGLYVQAISGPLGIPFGEFVNVRHNRGSYTEPAILSAQPKPSRTDYDDKLRTYPCTYYARAGISIPNVLMWHNQNPFLNFQGRLSFTFKWDEHACAEVAYFQFLVIAVWDFSRPSYHAGLSPVLFPGQLRFHTNGLAYPLYADWSQDELTTETDSKFLNEFVDPVVVPRGDYRDVRIISNFDYEHCVQHRVGMVTKGPQKGSCPPGPFQCSAATIAKRPSIQSAMQTYKEDIWREMYTNGYSLFQFNRTECPTPTIPTTTTMIPTYSSSSTTSTSTSTTTPSTTSTTTAVPVTVPPPPTPGTTTTSKPSKTENQTLLAVEAAKKTEKTKVISHGDICVFVWLVFIPVSNYMARFFKDFPNWETLGIGSWAVGHIIGHHGGVLMMWIGFGLVVSNGSSFLGGAPMAHYLFGFPCALMQHYELFNGFIRHTKPQIAHRQSLLHAVCGYIATLLGLFCAVSTQADKAKSHTIYALFAVNMGGLLAGSMVERKIAKRLGIYPPRRVFPILERIMMVNTKPRYYKMKIIVGVVYTLVTCAFYFVYWVYDDSPQLQRILKGNFS